MSLRRACWKVFTHDLVLVNRNRGELLNPLLFFIIVVSLFPLAITPEASKLSFLAPGVIWVAALLATMLSLTSLFRQDYADGSLEQLLLSPHPLPILISAKIAAHWLITGLPLLIIAPLLAQILYMPTVSLLPLLLGLALGTPILVLIGSIAVALTVSLRNNGVLLALLVLPLTIPVLIFGAGAVTNASAGMAYSGQILLLAAMLVLSITLAPLAIALSLRIGIS